MRWVKGRSAKGKVFLLLAPHAAVCLRSLCERAWMSARRTGLATTTRQTGGRRQALDPLASLQSSSSNLPNRSTKMALSRLAALRAAGPHASRHALRCSVAAVATPRYASTQPPTPTDVGATPPVTPAVAPPVVSQASPSSSRKSKKGSGPVGSFVSVTLFLFGSTFLVTYYLDSRSAIHRWVAMPFLHTFLDPETAQKLAIDLAQSGVAPRDYTGDEESLESDVRPT